MSRILIATRTPEGLAGGSGFHVRNMVEMLERVGHEVRYFYESVGGYDEPPGLSTQMMFTGYTGFPRLDAIIADYSWMCSIFEGIPDTVKKICFVHDLRCRIIHCLEKIGYKDNHHWTEEMEAKLLQKADILLVLNDEDGAFCKRMAPNAKIVRIGIAMEPIPHDPAKEIPGRCIYVGSENMENRAAIRWFLEQVWPEVRKQVDYAYLDICMGPTPDLDRRYELAQLSVVPHIMQGGMKIKTAEAIAHGLPVSGNVCAFDGFPNMGYDDPETLAADIILMLKDGSLRKNTGLAHHLYCRTLMTRQAAYGQLLDVLI